MIDLHLTTIIKGAQIAATLTGQAQIAAVLDLVRTSAEAYHELSGKPVDPDLVPFIEKIT